MIAYNTLWRVFPRHKGMYYNVFTKPYIFIGGLPVQTDTAHGPIGQIFIPGHLPGLLALLTIVQQQASVTPLRISIDSTQDFSVTFQEGFILKASFGEDAGTLARNLKLVLSSDSLAGKESQIDYVDLRFGNKAYYKMKGDSATSSVR